MDLYTQDNDQEKYLRRHDAEGVGQLPSFYGDELSFPSMPSVERNAPSYDSYGPPQPSAGRRVIPGEGGAVGDAGLPFGNHTRLHVQQHLFHKAFADRGRSKNGPGRGFQGPVRQTDTSSPSPVMHAVNADAPHEIVTTMMASMY